ncbi:MAG: hypothetical protein N4A40_14235 [Tissierellales bacterium]|jgi:hypothetical protein|nr:hypothetical protein [Tissierellales bacterium]
MNKDIVINKNKKIGKVLFIVEGQTDEIYILRKIFTSIFDYQCQSIERAGKYRPSNLKDNPSSSVFVVNTQESNISDIYDENDYLDELFTELINNYEFPVDKAAVYYIFDRDVKSNSKQHIEDLIYKLQNSRENEEFDKAGLLLLSYPAIESFTVSNFIDDSFDIAYELGNDVKTFLHSKNLANQRISKETLSKAVIEMTHSLETIGVSDYDLDNFGESNEKIFNYQENYYDENKVYKLLSLFCIAFIDLGLIQIEENVDTDLNKSKTS